MKKNKQDRPIPSDVYPAIDNDLARDNIENHIPAADMFGIPQMEPGRPFPLGVYPVFEDDLPQDYMLENFSAPDLRDGHPYPWGLE